MTTLNLQGSSGHLSRRIGLFDPTLSAKADKTGSARSTGHVNSKRSLTVGADESLKAIRKSEVQPALDRVVDATLTDAKIWISRVAAHIPDPVRKRLFKQLDQMHDLEEWEAGDRPMKGDSFRSFARLLLLLLQQKNSLKWPGLGMSQDGRVLAFWGKGGDQLTLEFLPDDMVIWSAIVPSESTVSDSVVGRTSILKILHYLSPYDPKHWFHEVR